MLSCPSHYHLHHPHPSLLLLRPNSTNISSCLRRHNSKSTTLLLRHLSQDPISTPQHHEHSIPDEEEQEEEEEKLKLLQLSLATKRTPQFPGSIYAQSPSDPDVHTSLPPLRTLVQGKPNEEEDDEEKIIMRALEIRRKVTAEIFKEAMRKGKFGITYTTNLTNRLGPFIDYVMVEAAAMKRLPEFSESTFNFRAKTVIQDSNVVPLIR
jgi:mTERF domain-containing protein